MSYQAYLDNIRAKTGKGPDDFRKLAMAKGLLGETMKAGEIVAWLKKDFALGHGHAMAIYMAFKGTKGKEVPLEISLAKHFSGAKARWRPIFDFLLVSVRKLGDDISLAPAASYISILRGKRKMAIVQVMSMRMDVGIKLKGVPSNKRFVTAGSWNAMMTHRIKIDEKWQIDRELMNWMRSAYEQNGAAV